MLMIEKLTENPAKIPSPNRDEVMELCTTAFTEALNNTDISGAFKRNGLTIKLDGSEDHLVSTRLKALVWEEMKQFRSELLTKPNPPNLKRLEEVMIPPDGVKRKLEGVVEGVPLDEGEELLDGMVDEEVWDEAQNDSESESENEENSENVDTSNDTSEVQTPESESSVDPELKADLECLSRIESFIATEKKSNSTNILSFLVRMENMVAGERQRRRARAKFRKKTTNTSETTTDNDNNAFDIFKE